MTADTANRFLPLGFAGQRHVEIPASKPTPKCLYGFVFDLLSALVWFDVRIHLLGYFTTFYQEKIGLVAGHLTSPNVLSLTMAKIIGLLFLTFNRFTAIALPRRHAMVCPIRTHH